jgi:asparagine synthase (glutamine-hydrolysing)
MCGIAGIWSKTDRPAQTDHLQHMLGLMVHRGPDAEGIWASDSLVLGNRRLKILDLSDAANQPFTDGRDVLVFNGRIFNFREIRAELEGTYSFKTNCDTEVLFRALQTWKADALQKIYGQFAFAFYSHADQTLLLARDHAGICPLYVLETDEALYFSSEIHPLLKFQSGRLDPDAVLDYFTYRYNIQNGRTLFGGIRRFHPAHFSLIDLKRRTKTDQRYWRIDFDTRRISASEAQATLNGLLDVEIARQQSADVPVGIYLSGGIDSGALLTGYARSSPAIQSFTLQMQKADPDVIRVEELSRAMGFQANVVEFSDSYFDQLGDVVEDLEEPFGDLIVCANHVLARTASGSVTVVLSGEGGDEAFLGYDHQRAFLKLLPLSSNAAFRRATTAALGLTPAWLFARMQSYPGHFSRDEMQKVRDVAAMMDHPADAYVRLVSLFSGDELQSLFTPAFWKQTSGTADIETIRETFAVDDEVWKSVFRVEIEQLTLIVNLLKQERFGMRFSLEGCAPFASKPVLEFVASLPYEVLHTRINKELILNYSQQRVIKKKPFSFFHNKQRLARLIQLMDLHASTQRIEEDGIFSVEAIRRLRAALETGSILAVKKAMAVTVFMVWHRRFLLRWH